MADDGFGFCTSTVVLSQPILLLACPKNTYEEGQSATRPHHIPLLVLDVLACTVVPSSCEPRFSSSPASFNHHHDAIYTGDAGFSLCLCD